MGELGLIICTCAMIGTLIGFLYASRRDWQRYEKYVEDHRVRVKFQTAAHEAGHALAVLRSDRVKGRLHSVTTVPDERYGGQVKYNLRGYPIFVQWETVIISLGGAAGEYVAKGGIDKHSCSSDFAEALTNASAIAQSHNVDAVGAVVVDMQSFYDSPLDPAVKNVLDFCMSQAITRIRNHEREFFRLTDALLDRRELTGDQVREVLSSK